jgi:hypothetical protein
VLERRQIASEPRTNARGECLGTGVKCLQLKPFPASTVAGQLLSWTGVDRFNIRGDRMYEGRVYWDTRRLAERIAAAGQRTQSS